MTPQQGGRDHPGEREEFAGWVQDAYSHIYDIAHLRTHPLLGATNLVPSGPDGQARAWQLHRRLLELIEELRPSNETPVDSWEWRRYRLLHYRFVEGRSAKDTAQKLDISPRHCNRECRRALRVVAGLLWERIAQPTPDAIPTRAPEGSQPVADQVAAIRLEMARASLGSRRADLGRTLAGVLEIIQPVSLMHGVSLNVCGLAALPAVAVDSCVLRQLLLGLFMRLVSQLAGQAIDLHATIEESTVLLRAAAHGAAQRDITSNERLDWGEVQALFEATGISGQQLVCGGQLQGWQLCIPTSQRGTVLVIDDDNGFVRLLSRDLEVHGLQALPVRSSTQSVRIASELQPLAITLDLMMPEHDGWDVLQALTHNVATQHIPVIVCSVLNQRDLALALGATAFILKPPQPQVLASILDTLLSR